MLKLYEKIPLNTNIELDLPHFSDAGNLVRDISTKHVNMTVSAPCVWEVLPAAILYGGDGSGCFLQALAADSPFLDFTSGDYTLLAWIFPVGAGSDMIMCKDTVDVCGWEFYIAVLGATATLALRHSQGGSHKGASAAGAVTMNVWNLVGVTRSGLSAQFYVNGQTVTTAIDPGGMIDPVSAAAKKFHIGINNDEINNTFQGMMAHHRVWSRAILASEFVNIFNAERAKYGV